MSVVSLFKQRTEFERNKNYSIGDLCLFEAYIRAAEKEDRRAIDLQTIAWAKDWNKEPKQTLLLANALGLSDDNTFRLMPAGDPIDVELQTAGEILRLQISVADPDWINDERGGYVRRLQIEKIQQDGYCFGGGNILRHGSLIKSDLQARSQDETDEALSKALETVLRKKALRFVDGCSLLIYARGFYAELIDDGFASFVQRAIGTLGKFRHIYVVDADAGAFASILAKH